MTAPRRGAAIASLSDRLLAASCDEVDGALPATLRSLAGRSLFDAACCAGDGFLRHREQLDGLRVATGRASTLDGEGGLTTTTACALNALAIAAGDRDDVHWETLVHLGGIVWPVVIATAETVDASTDAAYRAAALGHEVGTRLARALGASPRRRWHATALVGVPAAAIAAASVAGAEPVRLGAALGHALSFVGGSAQSVVERSGTMLGHRAFATTSGLLAAELAAAGLAATRHGLEGERGLLREDGEPAIELLLARRGRLAIGESSPRLLPGHGFAHSAIAAADSLGRIEPGDVETVEIAVGPTAAAASGEGLPTTAEACWWSTPFCVAATLAGGPSAITDLGLLTSPDMQALVARCTLRADDSFDLGATVTVRTASSTLRASCPLPPGHVDQDPGRDELVKKWRSLGGRSSADGETAYDLLETASVESLRAVLGAACRLLWPASRP